MYHLNCIDSITSLEFPRALLNYQQWDQLSAEEMLAALVLADRLSPDVLIRAGVFYLDEDCQICSAGQNRFFF
jgi:hypothetical protein